MNRKVVVGVVGLVAVLLVIGLLVALLYPFQRQFVLMWVRVEGQLVSRHTSRPLPTTCVQLPFLGTTEEGMAGDCDLLRANLQGSDSSGPKGERAILLDTAMTDEEGRFSLYATAGRRIYKNVLGMRFRSNAPDFAFNHPTLFILREGSEPIQLPIPDGELRKLPSGAEVVPLGAAEQLEMKRGPNGVEYVPAEEVATVPVGGVVDLGSMPVAIDE